MDHTVYKHLWQCLCYEDLRMNLLLALWCPLWCQQLVVDFIWQKVLIFVAVCVSLFGFADEVRVELELQERSPLCSFKPAVNSAGQFTAIVALLKKRA